MFEVFVSDIHYPYHDVTAELLAAAIVRKLQPDIVYFGGDILDFYAVSSFDRDPARHTSFQKDIDCAVENLRVFRECAPNARMFLHEGNHESRLTRYTWRKAPELASARSLTVPALLGLQELEMQFIPQGRIYKIGELNHIHGNEIAGGSMYPARNIYLKAPGNIICGHYHKLQPYYHTDLDGQMRGAWVNGCLCTLTPEYVLRPQWTQGLTLIDYAKSGLFHVDQIPMFRHKNKLCAFVRGELLTVPLKKQPSIVDKLATEGDV